MSADSESARAGRGCAREHRWRRDGCERTAHAARSLAYVRPGRPLLHSPHQPAADTARAGRGGESRRRSTPLASAVAGSQRRKTRRSVGRRVEGAGGGVGAAGPAGARRRDGRLEWRSLRRGRLAEGSRSAGFRLASAVGRGAAEEHEAAGAPGPGAGRRREPHAAGVGRGGSHPISHCGRHAKSDAVYRRLTARWLRLADAQVWSEREAPCIGLY